VISRSAWLLFIACLALAGCQRRTSETVPLPLAFPSREMGIPGGPPVLKMLDGPPVSTRFQLTPLPDEQKERRYLSYDLNGGGIPEYFIEDSAGVHSMTFVIVDSNGNLIIRPSDCDACDRLVILSKRHNGYRDIIRTYTNLEGMESVRLTFDGKRYVAGRLQRCSPARISKVAAELRRGACVASWYADDWPLLLILDYGRRNSP